MPTESIQHLMTRLNEQGFTDQCRADDDGIHFCKGREVFAPEDLDVKEVVRIEGTSAPDEQVMIFALTSPDGKLAGTYCVGHGPDMDPTDADMMQRLVVSPANEVSDGQSESLHVQY